MSKMIDCNFRAPSMQHPRCCPHSSAAATSPPAWAARPGGLVHAPVHSKHELPRRGRLGKGLRVCAALAFESDSVEPMSRDKTMEEYLELKQFLLRRTQRAAGFVSLYILLAVSGEVCPSGAR